MKHIIKSCLKILIILFILAALVQGVIVFLDRGPPRLSQQGKITIRKGILGRWYNETNAFAKRTGSLPKSLYEIFQEWIEGGAFLNVPDGIYVGIYGKRLGSEEKKSLVDPNKFSEMVNYRLSLNRHGWFIAERGSARGISGLLVIDHDGNVYQMQEIGKEVDNSHLY